MSDGVNGRKDGDILEVTIDRPKANAIDLAREPPTERRVHVVSRRSVAANRHHHRRRRSILLAGLGPQGRGRRRKDPTRIGASGGFGGLNYPRNLNKPIIAAVNGIACGGGFEVVLGTDIIVMEEHAKFALPEINVGVLPMPARSSCGAGSPITWRSNS